MTSSRQTKKRRKESFPRVGTPAAKNYFHSFTRITRFFNWLLFMVASIDNMTEVAHQALMDVAEDEERKKELHREWKDRQKMVDELKGQRQFLLEVILIRHIENYLNYLSELLYEIFSQRPETLRSSDKVALAAVFQHESLEEFARSVAERKVEALSYSSFGDLNDFFGSHFHLELFPKTAIPIIVEAIETRNISVYNRCVISQRYCNRTECSTDRIGTVRKLYIKDLERLTSLLFESVKCLDQMARRKLKIKGVRFSVRDISK